MNQPKFMSYRDLLLAIGAKISEFNSGENPGSLDEWLNQLPLVFLDFPTDGRLKKYHIVSLGAEGLMLYNDEVTRPVGH